MSTITIEEAQTHLAELIADLQQGEEIVITRDGTPAARLVGVAEREQFPRKLGTLQGTVEYMATDFDAPLEEFKEYMP